MRMVAVLVSVVIAFVVAGQNPARAADGSILYHRCAACHLPDGAGVPGAYPPLAGRIDGIASSEEGRSYLVMVISKGLMGALEIDGVTYRGVMPAQTGLSNDDVAEVLNFLLTLGNNNATAAAFGADEVASIRASNNGLNARSVYGLRPKPIDQREPTP